MPDILLTVWIIFTFLFAVAEFMRTTGDFFPFAFGGLGGIICYLLGLNIIIQVAVAAVIAVVLFLVVRPRFVQHQRDLVDKPAIDINEHLGERVLVTGKIDDRDWGRIAIGDTEYRARAENPAEKYNVADYVNIVDVDGQWVIVKK